MTIGVDTTVQGNSIRGKKESLCEDPKRGLEWSPVGLQFESCLYREVLFHEGNGMRTQEQFYAVPMAQV